jgi:hypothetical protein
MIYWKLTMFKNILAIFKRTPAAPTSKPSSSSKQRKTVESPRIGELGEYKTNIQLDQLPKDCKYLSDIIIRNPKSGSGFSQIDHTVISPYGLFVIETKKRY